jgi:hypothetical protein
MLITVETLVLTKNWRRLFDEGYKYEINLRDSIVFFKMFSGLSSHWMVIVGIPEYADVISTGNN